ncbi:MAG: nucleotidyltransferase domain-containing protein [Candidatus Omnitrophica bacterium]|nr:nucleotidyltransferase domain-containing protein [Candidatus Omnitrophota bacterium]
MDKIKGLKKSLLDDIIDVILKYKKPEKIMVFGSRTGTDFRASSDIDIAIFGRAWTDKDINMVKNDLEENLKTPLKFDVLNFYNIDKDKLKDDILRKGRVIYGED